MTTDYIVDTNILILSFAGKLQERLPSIHIGISVITEIEMLAYPHLTPKDEQQLRTILSNLTSFSLSDDIKGQTIQLKRQFEIKLPDAIICATAVVHQATLLTNDKQLLNLPGLDVQSLAIC